MEKRIYSQNGEDGVLEHLFKQIGTTNKFYFEIGTADGTECNTRYLHEAHGFGGVLLDCDNEVPELNLHREFVTVENCRQLLEKYAIPERFDLFSIDIDFNDWHVLRCLMPHIHPRVIIVEYNASLGAGVDSVVPYNALHRFDGTTYFGASLGAFVNLLNLYGYTLVYCENMGVNAFFVQSVLVDKLTSELTLTLGDVEKLYKPPAYRPPHNNYKPGHAPDVLGRPFVSAGELLGLRCS